MSEPTPGLVDPAALARAVVQDLKALLDLPPKQSGVEEVLASLSFAATKEVLVQGLAKANELAAEAGREREKKERARVKSVGDSLKRRRKRLQALERGPFNAPKPERGAFLLTGRVREEASGLGLPNVTVLAVAERGREPFRRQVRTTPFGQFHLIITAEEIETSFRESDRLQLSVLDERDRPVSGSSVDVCLKPDGQQTVELRVDGKSAPAALALAREFAEAVKARIERTQRQAQILERRTELSFGRPEQPPRQS